jgi:hypothetical protein
MVLEVLEVRILVMVSTKLSYEWEGCGRTVLSFYNAVCLDVCASNIDVCLTK